ncbi:MAG: hypothetical protein U0Q15_03640 [Kineosporiaceae bacterium]
MTTVPTPDHPSPSVRRLAAGAAGAVIALSALIAVPAAGALGAGASPAADSTTPPVSTTVTRCGGSGVIQPFCTRTAPGPTTPDPGPSTVGGIDFETGGLNGWTTTHRKIRLKVVKSAAQAGQRGLRIDNLDRVDASPVNAATVLLPESRFTGTGSWRKISFFVRLPKAKPVAPAPTCPSYGTTGPTPDNRPKLRVEVSTPGTLRVTPVVLQAKVWQQVTVIVPASPGGYTLSVSREAATLGSSVHLDSIQLTRLDATPSASPTSTAMAAAASRATPTDPPTTTWSPTGPACTPRP